MAKRAIIGIALGILFAPVIYMMLSGLFMMWISIITVDFTSFAQFYALTGGMSMTAPIISVIDGSLTFDLFMSVYILGMFTWVIIGMWAGAIERSAGRGVGVAAGIWLGWLIIELIMMAIMGGLSVFLDMILETFYTLLIAILVAAIFGAITKSEEF